MSRAAAACLLALLAAGTSGEQARAQVKLPSHDPFYAVPAGIAGLTNGTVLRSRQVNVSVLGVPLPVKAWELEYKTLDAHDRPTAMVTTAMVPTAPWTGRGLRPAVSYQFAEDGSDSKCAPSYALHAGALSLLTQSNASTETALMANVLTRGWAVIAPDYEGPDSHFFAAPEEAHGVLDGIRAALQFTAAGFGAATPVAMIGYSGGGYATSVAALQQPSYAPELKLAGAAIGAPTEDVGAEIQAFNGSIGGGAIAMAIAALDRAYPEQHLQQYLNGAGRMAVARSAHTCLIEAAAQHPFARIQNWEAEPDALMLPAVTTFIHSISPRYMPGHPTVPVFEYHDAADEFAPLAPALDTMAAWCARGTRVDEHVVPGGEHIEYESAGQPAALDYLAARFAGEAAPSTCPPARSPAPRQPRLTELRVLRHVLRVGRHGVIGVPVRNPNRFAVTLVRVTLKARASRRRLAVEAIPRRIGATRTITIRLRLRRGCRHLRVVVQLIARGPDQQMARTRTELRLVGRRWGG